MGVPQFNRGAAFKSPLGGDVLALTAFNVHEELSAAYQCTVDLLSENFEISAADLLGQPGTIRFDTQNDVRHFNGVISEFHFTGTDGTHAFYQAILRPFTWLMAQRSDCQIFQDMTAPDIIKKVVADAGFAESLDTGNLSDTYKTREYTVQYNETDENFIYRLMQEEGISSFFTHEDGKHKLKLSDWDDDYEPASGYETLSYFPETGGRRADGEHIYHWQWRNMITPGAHATIDYDFKTPQKDMKVSSTAPAGHSHDDREVFEWPGNYVERGDGERYTKVRREQAQSSREQVVGRSDARGMSAGHLFKLKDFPRKDQNRTYLLLSAYHSFQSAEYRSVAGGGAGSPFYECSFTCSDPKLLYRPQRAARPATILGPQTAVVVGPKGEEIYTDEHGRIKVQFHWDRYGKNDENSSCWIRVAQPWAHKSWGGQHIPRIGQEVIVTFLEGDPDKPMVQGAVYNGDNPPPFSLPENKTQSGIRSNSTKDASGANELLFEDMKEMENIFVHAQKDYTERVLNTRTTRIDSHDVRSVGDNEYITIDKAAHRHVGSTSINIVGDTGPAASLTCIQAAATLGDTLHSLGKAATLPGTSPGKKAGTVALGIFGGWLMGEVANRFAAHIDPDFAELTAGKDPIADAGRALNVGGQGLGDSTKSAPIPFGTNVDLIGAADAKIVGGAQIEVIGAFKIDNVGINHVEGIGFNHYVKIGKDQFIQIAQNQDIKIGNNRKVHVGKDVEEVYGKDHTVNVGEEQFTSIGKKAQIQVGKEYKVLAGEKFLGESKVWEMYSDKKIKMSAPGGFIEITKSGILIRGKKVKIEGKKVDFKKKGGGKGTKCLKGMAKTATPFVK